MMYRKEPVTPAGCWLSGSVEPQNEIYHLQTARSKICGRKCAAIKSRPIQYSIVKEKSKSFRMCSVSTKIKSIIIGLSEVPPGYAVGFQFI